MSPACKLRYRPEIDGLRAIAVLAVVLFHMGFGCTGGYVGVDVFFVISGFLITSLIWKDLTDGRFTLRGFWERRARRIVPAAVAVTAATLIAGWFLFLPSDFASLGRAAASQAAFVANVHYWQTSGYFDGAAEIKPLLHTWTLALEEQFYFVMPVLLWSLYRSKALRGRKAVVAVLARGFALSFAASLYGVAHSPTATFYLLPSRAWELLLGSLIVFSPPPPGGRRPREALSLAGLALILVPVFLYTSATPFPGLAALSPCLGAALVIWANGREGGGAPTSIGAALSLRPMVFIGLISYSFYLWHWPLMAFGNYLSLTPPPASLRAGLLAAGFLLAVLSWKYVETPFRVRTWGASPRVMFAYAGAGLMAVFGCGLLCLAAKGVPQRFSDRARHYASAATDTAFVNELTVEDARAGRFTRIGVNDPALRPSVFVWGDSHAIAALPAIDAYLRQNGLAGRAATHSSTAPVLNWAYAVHYGLEGDAIPFGNAVVSYIKRERIPDVILISSWDSYIGSATNPPGSLESALLATVRRLVSNGCRPWVMLDVPRYAFNIPRALTLPIYSRAYVETLGAQPPRWGTLSRNDKEFIPRLRAAGAHILDPKPRFLDATGRHYMIESRGVALYRDNSHLSATGARLILAPFFLDTLKPRRMTALDDGRR